MTDTLVFDFEEQTVGVLTVAGEQQPLPEQVELVGTTAPAPPSDTR